MKRASLPLAALQASSMSPIRIGAEVALKTPKVFVSIVLTIQCREVADVDELDGVLGLVRREDLAALRDANGPVREAVGAVVRPDDEAGAHVRDAAGHGGFGGRLAQRLEAAVRLLGHLLDRAGP